MGGKGKAKNKRPVRGGAGVTGKAKDAPEADDYEADDDDEYEADAGDSNLELLERRLVAPRWQGIMKMILDGVDDMSEITIVSKTPADETVCVIDSGSDSDSTVITIHPHPWAAELAQAIWDEIDCDGLDPATVDPIGDGWVCKFEKTYE
jgi:hypothetical protein